jgi:hypothetical protein
MGIDGGVATNSVEKTQRQQKTRTLNEKEGNSITRGAVRDKDWFLFPTDRSIEAHYAHKLNPIQLVHRAHTAQNKLSIGSPQVVDLWFDQKTTTMTFAE